ncbi:ribosomal protein L16 Arg81 hydroxylase [Kineococcus radiotolerans]|uniref:Ribosomal protein L16 Arg81 hydroxylase n=1 Tax=Kineococcus radiotolerans TaxID=131568 RepID=A0A7W4XW86_KINRA|nr:cupin domain-containing protein [Kineococcus radiotolerans]MBB2899974.1 ribosomal protein L16 Arg81 hydroxylase [Kineococcus radiotolerans]
MTLAPSRPAAGADAPARGAGPALRRCFGEAAERIAGEHWNTRPLLVRAADRAAEGGRASVHDLLSPADVDELLGPRALRTPFFSLVQDGTPLPRSSYTRRAVAGNQQLADLPDTDRVAAAHAGGATIVLQALHRTWPALQTFCSQLAADLGHQCQVNVYVTPPGAQGFKPHHDTHDVIVLQVDGRKHWTIHPPAVELPLKSQPSTQLGPDPVGGRPPAIDTVLEPGDALYLPRGWLHSARTTEDRSIHLTVGLLATTWADVLTDAVASAGVADVALRRALPLPGAPGAADGVPDEEVAGFRAAAQRWLDALDDDAVRRLVARRRSGAVPAEPVGVLAQDEAARTLAEGTALRPRRGVRSSLVPAGEGVDLVLDDRRVTFPGWLRPALEHVLAAPRTSAADLAAAGVSVDVPDALVVLRRLLRERVLLPTAGEPR